MIVVNIYYSGEKDNALKFANEMVSQGIVDKIRRKEGNVRYEYFKPFDDENTILLIDAWDSQKALDEHHESEVMKDIARLREKYDLTMRVERYIKDERELTEEEKSYVRNA